MEIVEAMTQADTPREEFDLAVIGAGIVGASIAYHATRGAAPLRVLLLEAEAAAGYHTTGRSAALFAEGYGPPPVRALTRASRAFFEAPPAGFCEQPLLATRGVMFVGSAEEEPLARDLQAMLAREGCQPQWLDGAAARARVPVLREHASAVAVLDRGAFDIDVDALLQGFLRGARAAGAVFIRQARVSALRRQADCWQIGTAGGLSFRARTIVNAAGAWVDDVAALASVSPVQIEPRRRTAFLFDPPQGVTSAGWPAVIAVDESWYFKPDAGLLLGSPANADPVHPHDVVPEEFDVALGIHNIQNATTLTIRRPRKAWAGLRCFVADGEPVCGFAPGAPGFFWAAAVGGYGIQSAPAFGRLCAALLRGEPVPADIAAQGLDADRLGPGRLSPA